MLDDLQNKNVFSLRLKVWVLQFWQTFSARLFQALGATILKARSSNLSLNRCINRSRFDADLRTVGRVDSVKTGSIKLEMYDGALPLRQRWTSKQILYCILSSVKCTLLTMTTQSIKDSHRYTDLS